MRGGRGGVQVGALGAREALAAPVGRVFFAGEATHTGAGGREGGRERERRRRRSGRGVEEVCVASPASSFAPARADAQI